MRSLLLMTTLFLNTLMLHAQSQHSGLRYYLGFATSKPQKALADYYTKSHNLHLYTALEVPVKYFQWYQDEEMQMGSAFSVMGNYEKGSLSNPVSFEDMTARLLSVNARIYPFAMRGNFWQDMEKMDNGLLAWFGLAIVNSLYFDAGISKATLVEVPYADTRRTPFVYGFGLAPSSEPHGKFSFLFDVGFRHYVWTNIQNRKAGIRNFHMGFGVQWYMK